MWGSTFFLIHDLVERVPPADFLAVRFAHRRRSSCSWLFRRRPWRSAGASCASGSVLGVLYGVAQILQTAGLAHTAASRVGLHHRHLRRADARCSAAVLLRDRIAAGRRGSRWSWPTAGLARAVAERLLASGIGEALTLLVGRALRAAHRRARPVVDSPRSAVGLSTVQMVVIALWPRSPPPDGLVLPADGGQWASVLYMALVAGAWRLWAQTWAQSHLTATRAAIIMALEPVFAAFFAVTLGGESLTRGCCSAVPWSWRRCTPSSCGRPPRTRGAARPTTTGRGAAPRRLTQRRCPGDVAPPGGGGRPADPRLDQPSSRRPGSRSVTCSATVTGSSPRTMSTMSVTPTAT